jgi:hypothetical protein
MAQLLNPRFDSKLKVYTHPDGESNGSTSINSITLDGSRDNVYFVSVSGDRVIEIRDF